jgi:hypothetical protein
MLICTVRTTLEINDQLFRQAKKKAADDGIPLRRVVEAALQRYLSGQPSQENYRLQWRPQKGRLLPGVRIDDRDSLFDIMEGRK